MDIKHLPSEQMVYEVVWLVSLVQVFETTEYFAEENYTGPSLVVLTNDRTEMLWKVTSTCGREEHALSLTTGAY